MADCLLVVDRSETVAQPGLPSSALAAWILPIPEGETAEQVAARFAVNQSFPSGTTARVIDLSKITGGMTVWKLQTEWVPR